MKTQYVWSRSGLAQHTSQHPVAVVSGNAGALLRRAARLALAVALVSGVDAVLAADPLSNLPFNLSGGAPNIDIRLRYETVNLDGPLPSLTSKDEAESLTVRTRLGYTTGKWNEIDLQVEYEGLSNLGGDDYNSFTNGHTRYPVIADAKVNEVNQAWVRYAGLPKTQIKYGRQRILLDNQRFVGNVGWRQTEMTYDATLLTSTLVPLTTFNYAYLTNVNSFRFFNFAPAGTPAKLDDDINLKGHLINAQVAAVPKRLVLTGYGYLLDWDKIPTGAPAAVPRLFQDTQTVGLRVTGTIPVQGLALSYALEYADQQDHADADSDLVDADYSLAELSLAKDSFFKLKGTLGYELLSGDGTYAFQTPLATAHAFQGWADQFLVTPLTGLERRYVSMSATVAKFGLTAVYHDFQSDEGGLDYGSEVNLLVSYPVLENLVLSAKYASYSADDFPVQTRGTPPVALGVVDTEKTWVYAEYKF